MRCGDESPVTEEEIRLMIEQGAQAGAFEPAEQELIEGVFGLGYRRAAELMQPRMNIVWLDIQDAPETSRAVIRTSQFSHFPVGDGSLDKLLGFVHVKNLLDLCVEGKALDLKSCLRKLPAVPEAMRALKILEVFQQSRTHIAMVINEHGAVEGLITRASSSRGSAKNLPFESMVVWICSAGESTELPIFAWPDPGLNRPLSL